MDILMAKLAGEVNHDIQVGGWTHFPESRWREAILFYLFGVWADKEDVISRPKIIFGNVTLRLDLDAREYFAYGCSHDEQLPSFPKEATLMVGCSQDEVEQGLIRFVKNDRIKFLAICLPCQGRVELWKKEKRGQYGYTAYGIPTSWGGLGPGV